MRSTMALVDSRLITVSVVRHKEQAKKGVATTERHGCNHKVFLKQESKIWCTYGQATLSSTAQTLGSWLPIPIEALTFVCVSSVFCVILCRQWPCGGLIPRPWSRIHWSETKFQWRKRKYELMNVGKSRCSSRCERRAQRKLYAYFTPIWKL
jgi:hypothetical protein